MLAPAEAKHSLRVRVVDAKGRATRPGAEVRVYEAQRLVGTRLVDTGSSYNAQSDIPVHFGLGSTLKVDIEVIWPDGKTQAVTRVSGVGPSTKPVVVRTR